MTDNEIQVITAYDKTAACPGDLVSLADLRAALPADIHRSDVDAALRQLGRVRGIALVPEANQKTLTVRDRNAAVVVGDQARHLISIAD